MRKILDASLCYRLYVYICGSLRIVHFGLAALSNLRVNDDMEQATRVIQFRSRADADNIKIGEWQTETVKKWSINGEGN